MSYTILTETLNDVTLTVMYPVTGRGLHQKKKKKKHMLKYRFHYRQATLSHCNTK